MRIYLFFLLHLFSFFQIFSQETSNFKVSSIDSILKVGAHTVVRVNDMEVNVISASKMTVKNRLVVTVFNKKAEENLWM